jgi:hypothetical protein
VIVAVLYAAALVLGRRELGGGKTEETSAARDSVVPTG